MLVYKIYTYAVTPRIMNIAETTTLPKKELASTYVCTLLQLLASSPGARTILHVMSTIPLLFVNTVLSLTHIICFNNIICSLLLPVHCKMV